MALKPAIHGRDHCPGGADPIPCLGGGTPAAYLDDWDSDGTANLITTSTWSDVAGDLGGGNARYFTEAWETGDWGMNFSSGQISRNETALYLVSGSVTFGGAVDNNDTLMMGINFGAAERHVFDRIALDNGFFRVTGTAMRPDNLSSFPAHMTVWHNHGSDITIVSARLHVLQFPLLDDGEFTNGP